MGGYYLNLSRLSAAWPNEQEALIDDQRLVGVDRRAVESGDVIVGHLLVPAGVTTARTVSIASSATAPIAIAATVTAAVTRMAACIAVRIARSVGSGWAKAAVGAVAGVFARVADRRVIAGVAYPTRASVARTMTMTSVAHPAMTAVARRVTAMMTAMMTAAVRTMTVPMSVTSMSMSMSVTMAWISARIRARIADRRRRIAFARWVWRDRGLTYWAEG